MENKFYCSICNKTYKFYQSLWKHNNKYHKNEIKIKKYTCIKCNTDFDNKHKKYYHQKKCIIEIPKINEKENINQKESINIINSNNNSNNTINQKIIINNYRNDNIEYISEKFKDKLFQNFLCDEDYDIPIPKLIENIKFNPNHKENNNVKIKSDRSKIGFYYDQNKWKAINKNELLDELCNYSLKILKTYFKEREDELHDDIKMQFHSFTNEAKIKSELRNKIKTKIENIAYIFTINNDDDLDN
jgi:hypothetical protein